MLTDDKIIELIKEPEEKLNIKEPEISIISNHEALALRKIVEWKKFHSKHQATLDSCLRNINKINTNEE
ncbi:17128_t:CDS:2 [Funneliformis caledonium]|uniref:17128_t:CDS:1 n=1 Tax=Funneliformis caledonium TaxID=1117310 RepID=A0A9N9A9N6_9GLOM|nr:17128_t:CDS:2 [Funneliformis caledonium]